MFGHIAEAVLPNVIDESHKQQDPHQRSKKTEQIEHPAFEVPESEVSSKVR